MKKINLLIAIVLLGQTIYAQPVKRINVAVRKNEIGVSVGKNLTYPVGTYDDRWRENAGVTLRRLGFIAALHYQHNFNKHWALRTEFIYQRKRGYFDYNYYNYSIVDEIEIAIPIFVRYSSHKFFVEIGPYIGCYYGVTSYTCQSIGSKLTMDKKHSYSGKYSLDHNQPFQGACFGAGYRIVDKERFSVSINLRNDQIITIEKKFLLKHPLNTTSLLIGFNYKL
jgi:hypothetical protein